MPDAEAANNKQQAASSRPAPGGMRCGRGEGDLLLRGGGSSSPASSSSPPPRLRAKPPLLLLRLQGVEVGWESQTDLVHVWSR